MFTHTDSHSAQARSGRLIRRWVAYYASCWMNYRNGPPKKGAKRIFAQREWEGLALLRVEENANKA